MRKSGAKRGAQATVSEHRLMHLTAARARCELRARFWHLLCTHLCQPMLRRLGRRLGLACRDLEGPQQLDWLCDGGPDSDSAMVEWRLGGARAGVVLHITFTQDSKEMEPEIKQSSEQVRPNSLNIF